MHVEIYHIEGQGQWPYGSISRVTLKRLKEMIKPMYTEAYADGLKLT